MKNYIPRKAGLMLAWGQNFVSCLIAYTALLKLDSKKITELQALLVKLNNYLEKAVKTNHSRSDLIRKNTAMAEFGKKAGEFITLYLDLNPAMTNELRAIMGLKLLNQPRAKSVVPAGKPFLEAKSSVRQITVLYRDEENGRKAKPKDARMIFYRWDLLNEKPLSPEELQHTESLSSGPLVLTFPENLRGKHIYISARWENNLGKGGPWSDILKLYIA